MEIRLGWLLTWSLWATSALIGLVFVGSFFLGWQALSAVPITALMLTIVVRGARSRVQFDSQGIRVTGSVSTRFVATQQIATLALSELHRGNGSIREAVVLVANSGDRMDLEPTATLTNRRGFVPLETVLQMLKNTVGLPYSAERLPAIPPRSGIEAFRQARRLPR